MFDHLRHHTDRAASHTDDEGEREAFLELLVLAMYADRKVTQEELDALEEAEAAQHAEQHVGVAVAKVRRAIVAGGTDDLLADIAGRITSPALRVEAFEACGALLSSDGTTDDEVDFLGRVRTALS